MNQKKYFPPVILLFVKNYALVLFVFTLFRLILFFTEINRINNTVDFTDIFLAFLMGLRFDVVISSYILILPFTLLTVASFVKKKTSIVTLFVFYTILIVFSFAFLVCAIDIPYFNQFFSRFSITAFEWLDSPVFVFKMIAQEPRYWLIIVPFIFILFLFFLVLKRIFTPYSPPYSVNVYAKITCSILALFLMVIGMRGRVEPKSPIKIGTAYFCENAFLNQLGLNPNFTLIRSYLDSRKEENKTINLLDNELAIANMQQYLAITRPDPDHPLLRKIDIDTAFSIKYNVVLVIMESMSAAKMERHGNEHQLTPFLDSLSYEGYYFENAYSAGIHTMNGVFSSLFSFPALFRQHPMKESSMLKYKNGLISTLKQQGYSTLYFTTHDGQFDNIEGFLRANDCKTVITKDDYPSDMVKTTLGVPDDFMFAFSIPLLTDLYEQHQPFFATFMTASDHGPFYIPDYFKPKNTDIQQQIVEYADFSLGKFIRLSSNQPWFKHTLFVFVADHGAPIDGLYDMSIDYNHTPLLFFSPSLIPNPRTYPNMAGQLDIFPSIMGLLRLPYTNNTLGIDLFRENRPYIFFNADDKYGVMDDEWFLIVRTDHSISLYKYRDKDTRNYAEEYPGIVEKMNLYARSNLQSYQYILLTRKQ